MASETIGNLYSKNIKKLRMAQNLSQDCLSEMADISSGFLSEIESNKKSGTLETLAKIANALGVEPYELLLPQNQAVNYDSRRTKQLMTRLRTNLNDLVDTMEDYLKE